MGSPRRLVEPRTGRRWLGRKGPHGQRRGRRPTFHKKPGFLAKKETDPVFALPSPGVVRLQRTRGTVDLLAPTCPSWVCAASPRTCWCLVWAGRRALMSHASIAWGYGHLESQLPVFLNSRKGLGDTGVGVCLGPKSQEVGEGPHLPATQYLPIRAERDPSSQAGSSLVTANTH